MFRPAVLALSMALLPAAVQADDKAGRIVMTGTASVAAKPDLAMVSAGVVTKADNARDALSANSKTMREVFEALKALDIEDRDITTSSFNISPAWEHSSTGTRQRGYEVRNQVTIRLRDVSFVGAALDTLVKAGANQAGGVQFIVENQDELLDSARKEAVQKAKARATIYAEAAGVELGPILEITEGGSYPTPGPVFGRQMEAAMEAAPIASGEQDLSVSVTITWALD